MKKNKDKIVIDENIETKVIKKKKINLHKVYLLFVFLIFIGFISLYAVRIYNDFFKKEEQVVTEEETKLDEIQGYGYTLGDRDGELYKTYFEQLNTILTSEEINYEEYAKTLTSIFIVDFYTLNNKKASTDVGGIEFLYSKGVDNFLINAQENMYKSVQSDFNGERTQKLPIVKSVNISSIRETTLTYNEKKYSGYKLVVTWEYEEDLGYETKGTFNVINIKDKLYMYSKTGSY